MMHDEQQRLGPIYEYEGQVGILLPDTCCIRYTMFGVHIILPLSISCVQMPRAFDVAHCPSHRKLVRLFYFIRKQPSLARLQRGLRNVQFIIHLEPVVRFAHCILPSRATCASYSPLCDVFLVLLPPMKAFFVMYMMLRHGDATRQGGHTIADMMTEIRGQDCLFTSCHKNDLARPFLRIFQPLHAIPLLKPLYLGPYSVFRSLAASGRH